MSKKLDDEVTDPVLKPTVGTFDPLGVDNLKALPGAVDRCFLDTGLVDFEFCSVPKNLN